MLEKGIYLILLNCQKNSKMIFLDRFFSKLFQQIFDAINERGPDYKASINLLKIIDYFLREKAEMVTCVSSIGLSETTN